MQIYYTGTLITPDGSDTNSYGEGCEPGYGYTEACGWVDPDWTLWEVNGERDDVRPDTWTPDDGPMIDWVVARLRDRLGSVEGIGGDATLYASDSVEDYQTGRSISLAAHVKDASPAILSAVLYALQLDLSTASPYVRELTRV